MNYSNNQKVITTKKEVNAIMARQKFGELLDQAYHKDNQFIITRANKPMAAIISFNTYQQFLKQREKDFTILERVWAKVPKVSEMTAETDIATVLSDVRHAKATYLSSKAKMKSKRDL